MEQLPATRQDWIEQELVNAQADETRHLTLAKQYRQRIQNLHYLRNHPNIDYVGITGIPEQYLETAEALRNGDA